MNRVLGLLILLVVGASSWARAETLDDVGIKLAPRVAPVGEVVVRAQADVQGEDIVLGEIAALNGFGDSQRHDLAALVVGRAPRPGQIRELYPRLLRKLIGAHAPKAALVLPDRVVITRAAKRLDVAAVTNLLRQEAARTSGQAPERFRIAKLNMRTDWMLPAGEADIRVQFPAGTRFGGLTTAKVTVDTPRGHYADYYVTAEISTEIPAVEVRFAVARGQRIRPDDVQRVERPSTQVPTGALTSLDDVVGKEATQALTPGSLLVPSQVVSPLVLKRGQPVRLVIETPNLRVETRGLATEAGRVGQTVKAVNLSSQKPVYGTVVSAEEIHVAF